MTAGMLAFVVGLVVVLNLPVITGAWVLPGVAILAVLVVIPRPMPRFFGWLGVGVIWGAGALALMQEARPPRDLVPADVTVTGEIVGLIERDSERTRFRFRPQAITPYPSGRRLPRHIRVNWYGTGGDAVAPGERWRLSLRMERPRGLMNPVPFDYERYLSARRVDAEAYVRNGGVSERLGSRDDGLRGWRASIADTLIQHAPAQAGTAVWRAITVGDRRGLDDAAWETLRETGTAHLVAISGLHVGLVAALGWLAGRGAVRVVPRLGLWLPAQLLGGIVAIAAGGVYAHLAGWAMPTMRALAMLVLVAAAIMARRWWSPMQVLAVAMAAMAAVYPWRLLSAGFWLSFGAVALIMVGIKTAPIGTGRLALMLRLQCLLSLGMAVLTLGFFGQAAWLSLPVNLIAIPVFSLVLVPLSLITALVVVSAPGTVIAHVSAGTVSAVLDAVMAVLARIGALGGAIEPAMAGQLALALAITLAGGFLRGLIPLPVSILAGTALAVPVFLPPSVERLRLTVLEVGQGTAAVVAMPDYTLVYDTGPAWGDTSAARFSLWPYLESRGRRFVDDVVVSHRDRDHAGGLPLLRDRLDYTRLLVGEGAGPSSQSCHAGQSWQRGAATFRILWPPRDRDLAGNASSCVLLIEIAGQRLLLTGDIGAAQEASIVEQLDSPVDAILVPHHGSADASSPVFVRAVSPDVAIISSGYNNAYGLPDPAIVQRYRCQGARVLTTGRHGAVTVTIRPGGERMVSTHRREARRFYHEGLRQVAFPGPEAIEYDPTPKKIPDCQRGAR